MPHKNKKRPWKVAEPKKDPLNLSVAFALKDALIKQGYKGLKLEYLLATAAVESWGFYFKKDLIDNNFGGVKWTKRMEGTQGMRQSEIFLAPKGESPNHKIRSNYAHFDNMDVFAQHWPAKAHLTNMYGKNTIGPPLDATTLTDYAHRQALSGYHQADEESYTENLKKWDPIIKRELLQNPARTMLPGISANNDLNFSVYIKRHVMVSDKARLVHPYIQNRSFAPDKKKENGLINNVKKLFGLDTMQNMLAPLTSNTIKKSRTNNVGYAQSNGLPQMITAMQMPLLYNGSAKGWKSKNENNGSINYPYNNWNNIPLNDPLNTMLSSGSGIFSNAKANKKPGTMLMPAGVQGNGLDMLHGVGNNNSRSVSIHVNTPLIGQLTIHANSAKDGINDLRAKIEEVLLQALSNSGAIT